MDAQRRHLTPPHPGVAERQHKRPVLTAGVRQGVQFLVTQVPPPCRGQPRKVDGEGRVANKPAVLHRVVEHARQDVIRLPSP